MKMPCIGIRNLLLIMMDTFVYLGARRVSVSIIEGKESHGMDRNGLQINN